MNEQAIGQMISGRRVRLRPWQRGDALAQERWPRYTEPFSSLWNVPRSFSFDDLARPGWSSQRYAWAIDDQFGRMVGRISLREIDAGEGSARLGISLAQPYVGQGLGTEALQIFLDHYFGPLDFLKMRLDVAALNERAVRCYRNLGFQTVGHEWRSVGNDPSLRLLDDPRYSDLQVHLRRGRFDNQIEFYEMELSAEAWRARRQSW